MNPFPHLLAALRHNYRRIVLAVLNLIITLSVFFTVYSLNLREVGFFPQQGMA